MHSPIPLQEILILLSAAVIVVASFRMLGLSPILGYLAAGAAIGPFGLKVVQDVHQTSAIAEFGVVFLLFVIGLELSFERLKAMRKLIFGFGSLQVLITGTVLGLVSWKLGFSPETSLLLGAGLALSSTALVLQVLSERNERSSHLGRISLAVLLLQDLAVVPLLVLVPMLARGEEGMLIYSIGEASLKAIIALACIFIVGRQLLRPLFAQVAILQHGEIFTAFTLLVVLGIAWITDKAGLSLALGAFVAGLLVAETEYRHQVAADILPYKGLLLGLFFMAVGMMVDFHQIAEHWVAILGLTIALIALKASVIMLLGRIYGFPRGISTHSGLMLAQGGEFAFILFNIASEEGLISLQIHQALLSIVVLSMVLTPIAYSLGAWLSGRVEKRARSSPEQFKEEMHDLQDHVIIAGFGRVGQTVAKLLAAENIHYIALDLRPGMVAESRAKGLPVYYGDASRREVLQGVHIDRAQALIVTVNSTAIAERTVRAARALDTRIPIIARAQTLPDIKKLEKDGANVAISEMFEASLQMGGALLKEIGVADYEINRVLEIFRAEDYALVPKEGGAAQQNAPQHPPTVAFRKGAQFKAVTLDKEN